MVTGAAPASSIADALALARQTGLDRTDAHALLGHVLQRGRSWLIAHDTDALAAEALARFLDLVRARADGMPVAYLLGEREFHGLSLLVNPAVLVPRPDTETLVTWALECLEPETPKAAQPAAAPSAIAATAAIAALPAAPQHRPARVLDLGTGSGAIALAVAQAHPNAQVTATDRSPQALAVARTNAQRLGLALHLLDGHWWQALPADAAPFDLVLSNPPYIAEGDPHLPALRHEPAQALVAGPDGLNDLREIIASAAPHLLPGGWLLLEHGHDQALAVAELLRAAGFAEIDTRRDLGGQPRCTGGRRNPR